MSDTVRPGPNGTIVLPDGTVWVIPPHPLSGRIQSADELIPRMCHVPAAATYSSGYEAIELAAAAGLHLDPWEQLTLILGLGETDAGKWAAFMVALIVARQNGKGADLEALGLYWLFGTGERLIGHTAHEYKTAMEAFRRILFLIENSDFLRKKVKKIINTNGEEGIELLNGQRMRFLARSKGAGRGFTFNKLIWDEAYALSPEQQEAQLPTLSAVINGQIWLASSPPLTSETGQPLFLLRRKAATATDVTFMDYGAEGSLEALDEVDLDDEAMWLKTNPNAPERISIEAMRRERVAMGDRGFARERLCIWPPDLSQGFTVISQEQWNLLLDPLSGSDQFTPTELLESVTMPTSELVKKYGAGPPRALVGRPCVSVDVTPRGVGKASSSIGIAQARRDGIRHIELIKTGLGTDWLVSDLVKLVLTTEGMIAIDPGSPAGSILADLQDALRAAGLNPDDTILTMAARDVAQAFGMIYDAATGATAETRSVCHLGQSEVALAIGGAVKRPIGDGHAWDRRLATTNITPIVCMTHALWGLAKMGNPPEDMPLVVWA